MERMSAILLIQHEIVDRYGIWRVKRQHRDPLRREEDHGGEAMDLVGDVGI